MKIETKPHIGKRILATIVDYGIIFLVFALYTRQFGEYDTIESSYKVTGVMTLPLIAFWFLYLVIIEYLSGYTLGHFMVDLKITNVDGSKTILTQNLKRRLIDFIDILMWGIPAMIAIKSTDKNQRLGDLWAKTIVVSPKDFKPDELT